MRILAIRHAPTLWNAEKRLQGLTDIPLSEQGRAVAQSWCLSFAWREAQIYASPLKRARETAALIFPDREIKIEKRLVEMNFGTWEGKSLKEIRASDPGAKEREAAGLDFRAPQGESPREVQQRLLSFIKELAEMSGNVILITHKAVIRSLYSLATGWPMKDKPPHKFQENCARLFDWHDGSLTLLEVNYPLRAEAINSAAAES